MIPRSEFPISSRHRARRVLSSVCGPRRHGHPLHLANNWTCTLVLCDTVRCQAARFRDTGRLRASGCDGNMGQGQNLALSCVTRRSQETGGDPASPTQGEHAASFSWASFPQLQVRKKVACSPPDTPQLFLSLLTKDQRFGAPLACLRALALALG